MRSFGLGLAVLATSVVANKEDVTYSCPKGWEQSGELCTRSRIVKAITKNEVSFNEVPSITSCPSGYESSGSSCTREVSVKKISFNGLRRTPSKVCPKGAQQTKEGCVITRTVVTKYADQVQKQVTSQRAVKKTEYVAVKKPVSVLANPQCPKGAQGTKSGCVVTISLAGYEMAEVTRELKVRKNEKVVEEVCPNGGKAPCRISITGRNQTVKESTSEKTVKIAQLAAKTDTVTLRSKVKVAKEVCPEGSKSKGKGCFIELSRQVVKNTSVAKTVSSGSGTHEVTKTLKLAKTTLVPMTSCPKGSESNGKGCSVSVTGQAAEAKETSRTVKIARAVKVPKTVRVTKIIAKANESCPKGASQGSKGKGACVVSATIKVPYTVETAVAACPGGAKEENGVCITERKVYVSAEEVPMPAKGGKGKGSSDFQEVCPAGTQKDSSGLCYKIETETVAAETLTEVKVLTRTETIEETVPMLVSYTTETVSEEVTVDDIKIEYDTETVTETSTSVASHTSIEEIPAIVTYVPETSYETVTVTDVLACGGGGAGGCGGGQTTLTETGFSVETETYEEEVAMITMFVVEDHVETQTVEKQVIAYVAGTVTETVHTVVDQDCGSGSGAGCSMDVSAVQQVSFKDTVDVITVTDHKVKTTATKVEEEVRGQPAYKVVYEEEHHESAHLEVDSFQTSITETLIRTRSETVTEQVEAGTVMKAVSTSEEKCPDDARETGKGCVRISTASLQVACPKGAQMQHGKCVERSTSQTTACPPGAVESGHGCEMKESIPATASYSAPAPPKMATPKQTKEGRM